ncbi:FeoB-associated Cys-rich membrane protein [Paenibacillus glufosinatiresistens]|uniref:FeoB-associated Cys-rich membrane protein n=1 Tax=Paenibacillus glufosinatiresistens TaxID=3070657 RepID=UPI00286DD07E|nr:FeoB-associated Cys-rich membrane protein [Paenibacillus sp. YX.27]
MFVNLLIVAAIFGYTAWVLYRHIQKSKKGACAGCDKSKTCPAASSSSLSCCGPSGSGPAPGSPSGREA